ncbi:cobalt-zinc-cadmium efflux system outer membrane protein [Sulfuritortus calidifontis]|uniref:Cobalt-zinc-cadmium efflux system outer membrane protein n=1 Tax=Sulfuritortus calidifontis TaxID=1914471 RepID=A0A4R3JXZ6_9PROT|nr:TolC family protein [Sulfuritortus calidifontis]TCS71957.1 cobalt-zinc-cadmium efflux system outer membrane protein [Sulfuritortus calidifontis]
MLKDIHNYNARAVAAGLLLALMTGTAFAQLLPTAPALGQSANGVEQIEAATPLTLQKAVALALEANLDLTVAQREIEAVEGQVIQGRVRPNPELAYSLEDQRTPTRTQSVQINLPIELGGKRAARIAAAERGRDVAVEELNTRRVEIRAAVVAAFFETLAAQERAALAQASVDLAKRATDAVAKRVAAGKVSPVEETKARVAEAGVRVELAQAQSEQRNARARLASLLGANPPRFTLVSGNVEELPAVPSLDNVQQRLSTSPTLRRMQLEVERRRSLVDVERSKRIPDVTFSLGVKRPTELQRNQLLFGVSVPLPLFDRNQGNLLEALKREDKARDELQALNIRVSTDVLQARERLESIRREVDVLQQDVLPGAKSAYDAATVGFENGKFNFLEVLDAQRTYFAAKSQYLKALAEAHRTAADIDRVLGEPGANATQPANKE